MLGICPSLGISWPSVLILLVKVMKRQLFLLRDFTGTGLDFIFPWDAQNVVERTYRLWDQKTWVYSFCWNTYLLAHVLLDNSSNFLNSCLLVCKMG